MKTFRIFVQDVGKGGFSGFAEFKARDYKEALAKCVAKHGEPGPQLIALPNDRKDLWPDGQTGAVPKEALRYRLYR